MLAIDASSAAPAAAVLYGSVSEKRDQSCAAIQQHHHIR